MTDRRSAAAVTFEMLNAYVDGELDAAQAALVARAVAENPMLAREVAALTRLRSAIAEGLEAPAVVLPDPARPAARRRLAAVSAAAALVLAVAAALMAGHLGGGGSEPGWLADAWQAHRAWAVDRPADERPAPIAARVPDAGALSGAYVPDLTASRLTLVHSQVRPLSGGGHALVSGYRGSRGCKISLIVFPTAGGLPETLQPLRRAGQEAFGWRAGGLDYVILSDGMERGRFAHLAESVRESSRRHAPFDAKTRMALRESRDNSAPCPA